MSEQKRTVTDIIVDKFLKEVEKNESLPWQRPYQCYNAFNYFTKTPYKGINRLMLEFGEYMTENQIRDYNKTHNTDYRFQKGIVWIPVIFYKEDKKDCSFDEVVSKIEEGKDINKEGYLGYAEGWAYYRTGDSFYKTRKILRYTNVAERQHFKNSKGGMLPSRIETGEVEITLSKPQEVFDNYIDFSGVKVNKEYPGVPCYVPMLDTIQLNPYTRSEEEWFSTAFHEIAHSTGAAHRLNRVGVTHEGAEGDTGKSSEIYAVEECIAEITASLCCAECGIHNFVTSETQSYQNNIAYVSAWKKRIKDFGKEFIYIVSQADKAFNYIMDMEI